MADLFKNMPGGDKMTVKMGATQTSKMTTTTHATTTHSVNSINSTSGTAGSGGNVAEHTDDKQIPTRSSTSCDTSHDSPDEDEVDEETEVARKDLTRRDSPLKRTLKDGEPSESNDEEPANDADDEEKHSKDRLVSSAGGDKEDESVTSSTKTPETTAAPVKTSTKNIDGKTQNSENDEAESHVPDGNRNESPAAPHSSVDEDQPDLSDNSASPKIPDESTQDDGDHDSSAESNTAIKNETPIPEKTDGDTLSENTSVASGTNQEAGSHSISNAAEEPAESTQASVEKPKPASSLVKPITSRRLSHQSANDAGNSVGDDANSEISSQNDVSGSTVNSSASTKSRTKKVTSPKRKTSPSSVISRKRATTIGKTTARQRSTKKQIARSPPVKRDSNRLPNIKAIPQPVDDSKLKKLPVVKIVVRQLTPEQYVQPV